MKLNKWIFILVALSLMGTAVLYPCLPEQVPGHWNTSGKIDRYQDKVWVFVTVLLPLAIYLLMQYLPKIDPKRASYDKHKKAYKITQLLVVFIMISLHWITMAAGLGYAIDVGVVVRIVIGLMFVIMGNYMSQIRQNYFFGIKTPWTLANEKVWKKTHRVGAYCFIVMGIIMIATIFIPGKAAGIVTIVSIFGSIGYIYLYSYLAYRKFNK